MRVHTIFRSLGWLTLAAVLMVPLEANGAPPQTASGTVNAILSNKNGIALVFDSNPGGVALGGNGTATASLDFGAISAYGTLSPGVTRTSVSASSFTVQSFFDVDVLEGGGISTSYTLTSQLAAVAPTGLAYGVDGITLTTTAQTLTTTGAYNTDVSHTLSLAVSTAAPGAGGPATGTALTTTIDFTATAN